MTKVQFFKRLIVIGLGGLISLNLVAVPSFADSPNETNGALRQGLPGRRIGGGTRAPELSDDNNDQPLVALMPDSNLAITTAAYPTLLFHLPVVRASQEIEFVLYDSENELIYEAQSDVVESSGIVAVDLSSAEALEPLDINKTYKWYFTIVADDRSQDIVVDGWVQRVVLEEWVQQQNLEPDLVSRLSIATPLEKARLLYEEANIFPDAALALHELRLTDFRDEDVVTAWKQLLESLGLSNISEEPVAELIFKK